MVAVVGAGGHGQDIAAVARSRGTHATLYDHDRRKAALPPTGLSRYYVGVNDPVTRLAVVSRLDGEAGPPLIDRSAVVSTDCTLGHGVVVGALASLLTQVTLGTHTHVGAGSHLTRCTVGDFTTIAPGVTICGDVTIGSRTLIGAGAVIKNLLTVGDDVTIGCGAVVVRDVPDGATVKGNPAA